MGMTVKPSGGDDFDDDDTYHPIAEINITPFVDVMLVLLIIFMVAAPLMVAGVPVNLPSNSAAKLSRPKEPIIVSLQADGGLFLRKRPVEQGTLVFTLSRLRASEGDTIVYVRADKTRPYGEVMELLGKVGESGYQRISLLSQPNIGEGAKVFDAPATPASPQ